MLSTGHVIVCGLDHLGLRTIDELRMRDEEVVGIGANDDAAEHLADTGVRLVVGDPLLARVLSQADVETASAIVMTGDDDLANLNIALAAVELNPSVRIVIRMFDQELGSHIPELFPDAVALSSSALAAPGFVSAAIDGETGTRFRLAGRLARVARIGGSRLGRRESIPIARLHADRTVELLPDAPSTRSEPHPRRRRRAGRGRRAEPTVAAPRPAAPRPPAVAERRRVDPGPASGPGAAAAPVRGDPGHPGRRLGDLLRRRRRADAARRGLVRHHAADRRLAAGRHRRTPPATPVPRCASMPSS